ncbi:MAG TPA: long-chain-acyl-CoA synthetase [Xanthobacteraceae bacterium]|nr:long-chain-acyl-CoA synthetase [Xanthobacteraceae bacterium]
MGFVQQIKDDLVFLRGALRALKMTTPIAKNRTRVFPVVVEELAEKFGEAPALISERERLTFRSLLERSNRYARWAQSQHLAKGETVCLLMPNRPEYMAVWVGITRVGGVAALLNTNLVGPSLAHCIDIVQPKLIIVAAELAHAFASAKPLLKTNPQVWSHGASGEFPRIDSAIENLSGGPLAVAERPALTIEDRALYIYTSGTTGMPKAANVNHYRVMLAACAFAGVMDTKPSDRMYDCLPMYHTAGGLAAIGALLVNGGSVFIREKFSVRDFWDDVVRFDCTLFQYIGELCRYLVQAPPNPNEIRHRLRLACGNGLRPDLWVEFKKRFRIPQILEFYGATEGNVNMFNFEGKPGAVGRIPWFVAHRFPTAIVKFDVDQQTPVRDANGLCVRCAVNEPGEVIGKIVNDASKPGNRFEGYARTAENENKILRNVFKPGDVWFRTGDLMRKDKQGYFYFVDRIGDTFRWKGENVSTSEVAETINVFPGVKDANVYGVQVPGRDGRAGMAAIVYNNGDKCDLAGLYAHLSSHLPEYARPLFLRIQNEIEVTGTFKQKKIDLARQGFDPAISNDPIYFNDSRSRSFVRLDPTLYNRITSGQVRL